MVLAGLLVELFVNMKDNLQLDEFPWTVIESPKKSFFNQSKVSMRVASKEQGGSSYDGPKIVWPQRWSHVDYFYILEPVELGMYVAKSLHDRFHYQIKRSEKHILDQIVAFCKQSRGRCKYKMVGPGKNHIDDNILVVHDPSRAIKDYLATINDEDLLQDLLSHAKFDRNRGNLAIDTGYASAKCQERDKLAFCISKPTLLARTKEDLFLQTMVQVSTVMDMLCKEFSMPKLFRVNGIDKEWARQLHPDNVVQSIRNSVALASAAFGGHLDSQNDPRELMCAVPVVHRIFQSSIGPIRHAKIGYSRKACYEAGLRLNLLQPIVKDVASWYYSLDGNQRVVSNKLFLLPRSPTIDRGISFPVHCKKSVGLSTFIDAVILMQQQFDLSKEQCIGLAYNILTSESPFYFWKTAMEFMEDTDVHHNQRMKNLSPINLGLEYHRKMWDKIEDGTYHNIPRHHQPHNNYRPEDELICESITSLIHMCDAFWMIHEADRHKQYYHSMAVGLLVKSTQDGGCYGAGFLTSQGLLYALACLGLIPIGVTHWGEVATNPKYLNDLQITIGNGKADMFLTTLAHHLGITPCEAEQINCKYGRQSNTSEGSYKDAIYPTQRVYEVRKDGKLNVFDGTAIDVILPPAHSWRDTRQSRKVDALYWFNKTKKKVRGGNRINKKKKQKREEATIIEIEGLPTKQQIFLASDEVMLSLRLNSLLGIALGGTPLPWAKIMAVHCKNMEDASTTYHFAFANHQGQIIKPEPTDIQYTCPFECKVDGILRFTATNHCAALSKAVFLLIDSPAGKEQHLSRDLGDNQYNIRKKRPGKLLGYYILYHTEDSKRARKKGHERKIAVVNPLNCDTLLFAIYNENYGTEKINCCLLHRN